MNKTVKELQEANRTYVEEKQAGHKRFRAERNQEYAAMKHKSREDLDAEVEASKQRVDARTRK